LDLAFHLLDGELGRLQGLIAQFEHSGVLATLQIGASCFELSYAWGIADS
jgi:hypothetical protein